MKEQLITFDTAKLAKDKGFNIPTRSFYANWDDGLIPDETVFSCSNVGYPEFTNEGLEGFGDIVLIPTQSLLKKWLRDIHNLHCSSDCNASGWMWIIEKTNGTFIKDSDYTGDILESGMWESYEEALEQGLIETLKLIK